MLLKIPTPGTGRLGGEEHTGQKAEIVSGGSRFELPFGGLNSSDFGYGRQSASVL